MIRRSVASLAIIAGLFVSQTQAYGPRGHAMVGAIADQRLAGKAVGTKIADLLDGLTLSEAALLPDQIKNWDHKDPATNPDTFHLPDHPVIEKELLAFWKANPPTGHDPSKLPPNHHWFHYTDVPVASAVTYASGKTGRSRWDVVQMIPYCADVLRGKISEDNERKITKCVAVILLAHYIGDVHHLFSSPCVALGRCCGHYRPATHITQRSVSKNLAYSANVGAPAERLAPSPPAATVARPRAAKP